MWQVTHGRRLGAYQLLHGVQLSVRREDSGRWSVFVDGRLEGTAVDEACAKAACELAARDMIAAQMPADATAA